MKAVHLTSRSERTNPAGFTLLELIVAGTILSILTLMAQPLARLTIQREKEKQLRRSLWEMRDAIDNYKQAADRGAFQIKVGYGNDSRQTWPHGHNCLILKRLWTRFSLRDRS
jgi:prepilin-type N-terminal cleavage/methylation domain-containing protein